ncbi:MAG: LptE family protein [Thermodesulfobacteriaceae bacterium]|nr:LptE family protein [Thermodesulfobacteriaceae bacterium]
MWFLFRKNLLILWWLNFLLLGCGYTFYERPTYFKDTWKSIYIAPFKNYTQEPELSEWLAYELRHKFAQGKLLKLTYSEEQADLLLKGEIKRIYLEPVSYEVFLQTRERKILFEGKVELIERATQQKIYENPKISRFEVYRVSEATTQIHDLGKYEALKRLAKDLSEIIFQDIWLK